MKATASTDYSHARSKAQAMSLEETKQLLRTYRISPNKLLGQNFMVETSLYPKLCDYAALKSSDVVLDAGAGLGFLALFLSDKCKAVIAVEKDRQVAEVLREQTKEIGNVNVIEGDVLKVTLPNFNKVIAIPPYYLSSHIITWLIERKIDCAVMILQKEFSSSPFGASRQRGLRLVNGCDQPTSRSSAFRCGYQRNVLSSTRSRFNNP